MTEQQVMLDTFVAKVKAVGAFSRGDLVQVENYLNVGRRLTAGESGHFAAAATGESLATKVIREMVDLSMEQLRESLVAEKVGLPTYPEQDLTGFLDQLLERELPPTLGDIPPATRGMIHHEILSFAKDISLGKNSKTFEVYESLAREGKLFKIQQLLDRHGPWVGKLVSEIVKSMTR